MTSSVLAILGEDAFLRDDTPCRVNIEHGVQIVGSDGIVIVERAVATFDVAAAPKVGDTLTHPDGNYKLDAVFASNGASARFVLLKV